MSLRVSGSFSRVILVVFVARLSVSSFTVGGSYRTSDRTSSPTIQPTRHIHSSKVCRRLIMSSSCGKPNGSPDEHQSNQTTSAGAGSAVVKTDGYCLVQDEYGNQALENMTIISEDNTFESLCALSPGGEETKKPIHHWIRLQVCPDRVLQGISCQQDVLDKIAETREMQAKCSRADLYPRFWQPAQQKLGLSTLMKQIPVFNNINKNGKSQVKKETHSFSVMQFNTLAEGLSAGPDTKTPFRLDPSSENQPNSKGTYGGFTHIKFPEVALDFGFRRWRLLEVLLGSYGNDGGSIEGEVNNSHDELFDLIAMEEVDRYHGFFAPVLNLFGYHGIFMPKPSAPGVRLGWYSDGCALFYQKDKFELILERRVGYRVGTQVFIVAILKHLASGRLVVVAVTHLKAQKSVRNEIIRTAQVSELLEHVEQVAEEAGTLATENEEEIPILIMGDLNADPPPVVDQGCVERILKNHETNSRRYHSVYPIDPARQDFFTTWKTRGDYTAKRIIDYVFYSNGLQCTHTINIPDPKELETDGFLPGLRYPSDHMSIAAKFDFCEE